MHQVRAAGSLRTRLQERTENKLDGPAGPHVHTRNGPVPNGHPSTSQSHSLATAHTLALALATPPSQPSPSQPSPSQASPPLPSQQPRAPTHRATRSTLAPLLSNRFAPLHSTDAATTTAAGNAAAETVPSHSPALPVARAAAARVRFSRKKQLRTYTSIQPLLIPSMTEIARPAPARSCMRRSSPLTAQSEAQSLSISPPTEFGRPAQAREERR